jgi:hypothetical protein
MRSVPYIVTLPEVVKLAVVTVKALVEVTVTTYTLSTAVPEVKFNHTLSPVASPCAVIVTVHTVEPGIL